MKNKKKAQLQKIIETVKQKGLTSEALNDMSNLIKNESIDLEELSREMDKKMPNHKLSDDVRINYVTKFYDQNIKNFQEVDSVGGMKIFSGTTKEGNCIITEYGGLLIEKTGVVANPVTFLMITEPLLTELGAYNRFFTSTMPTQNSLEGVYVDTLYSPHLINQINSFRTQNSAVNMLKTFGLEIENIDNHPFWFDGHNKFYYIYTNRINYPVCKHNWRFDGSSYFENIYGTPRLNESPEADRIYFVENPMQLISMSDFCKEPVYVRPSALTYQFNDYGRLMNGKDVICMKAKNHRNADPTTFELSHLESNDPLDLLHFYGIGELNSDFILHKGKLRDGLEEFMENALESINQYIKEKK